MGDCFRENKSERNTKNKVPDESASPLRRLIQKKRETVLFEQPLGFARRRWWAPNYLC
jgi:hypothetical protein